MVVATRSPFPMMIFGHPTGSTGHLHNIYISTYNILMITLATEARHWYPPPFWCGTDRRNLPVLIYPRGQRMYGDIIAYLGFVKWSATWFLATLFVQGSATKTRGQRSVVCATRISLWHDVIFLHFGWRIDPPILLTIVDTCFIWALPCSTPNLPSLSSPHSHHCDLTLPLFLRVISLGAFVFVFFSFLILTFLWSHSHGGFCEHWFHLYFFLSVA